ncbi:Outer membrane porin protein 32 [Paraburkholderia nemoris]|uniref:porin n=1 Tax=Paraburkholderia nemoris TaxID=2793076 RepID=UPI001913381F|nr:porin [Paraburkholderia nemoris]MBK5152868.1 porin [Burkholderia sp. R-69608]CAE6970432.1 Outer membrane porin protein 32 [Paraburkholderia nemoris]
MKKIASCSIFLAACLTISQACQAQSSVQLYGLADMYVGAQKALGGKTTWAENSGGMSTSFWGLGGREDLGSGYSAVFAIEAFFRPSTGAAGRTATDTFFGRNAYVGLKGPQGTLLLGRNTLPYYVTALSFNPFGNSFGFSPALVQMYKGLAGQGMIGDTNWNNSVMYISPNLAGFTATGIYGSGNQAGHPGTNQVGADLKYSNGAFASAFSFQRAKYSITPGDLQTSIAGFNLQTAYLAAASYDFRVVKISALLQRVEDAITPGDENSNSGELGASIPVGPGAVLAAIMYTKSKGRGDPIRRTWSVGYDYPLSKRTDVYAAYMNDTATGLSSGYNAGLGIRTRF